MIESDPAHPVADIGPDEICIGEIAVGQHKGRMGQAWLGIGWGAVAAALIFGDAEAIGRVDSHYIPAIVMEHKVENRAATGQPGVGDVLPDVGGLLDWGRAPWAGAIGPGVVVADRHTTFSNPDRFGSPAARGQGLLYFLRVLIA